MTDSILRVPTGRVDEELRIMPSVDGRVPELEIQPWRHSLATGGWAAAEGPAALQLQFVERLCEVLRQQAHAVAPERGEYSDLAPIRIPLSADLELRFTIIVGDDGHPVVEVGHWRASPNDATREFHPTAARWRVAGHLFPLVLEAAQKIAPRLAKLSQRAGERSLFAPAAGEP